MTPFVLQPEGRVKVFIKVNGGGKAPEGMEVSLRPIETGGPNSNYQKSGADGALEIKGVTPGIYAVWVSQSRSWFSSRYDKPIAFGQGSHAPEIIVEAGKTTGVEVGLDRLYRVKGRLQEYDQSQPVPAKATQMHFSQFGSLRGSGRIEDGSWQTYLAAGEYSLEAGAEDGTVKAVTPLRIRVSEASPDEIVTVELQNSEQAPDK